ncbi:hypothetical protein BN59_01775 [Legionella massiliensis]|uniref:Uncharacterized protein n=1 Tax=Legionella massiliensis TaxID=1034943 RepID=A0A078KWV5_9GAMM|nr:hypothetical protein [Legionella massiliensis]CDZ77492.1 hypothetical protein BN59_01775 [Legionella massiliensis]CEE13230.1 hypothetical protein BN1094_01775 [Legionella massiliensis]
MKRKFDDFQKPEENNEVEITEESNSPKDKIAKKLLSFLTTSNLCKVEAQLSESFDRHNPPGTGPAF